jgi:16S rRNA (uracil1498-N3)-methyltransferase
MAKLHRFYVHDMELKHDFWMKDTGLFHQWTKVLRFQTDREVVLFNEFREEKLYKIVKIGDNAVHLQLVTEMQPKFPENDVYLCFSLLKKDKNDWILQKATELGVGHFLPMLSDRTEKTGFDVDRAKKIVIEAAEQCGRADIPRIRGPITPESVIHELIDKIYLYVAEQGSPNEIRNKKNETAKDSIGILIGPEGGWTEEEKKLFAEKNLKHLSISNFTLRAETAAVTASALLQ